MSLRARGSLLAACLFLSGAAALIYELIWFRQLSLVMGHTVQALSALLTAFLGGLALGAAAAGRWIDRRGASPRLYALLELGVALSAPLVAGLMALLDPVLGASGPAPALVLLLPSALMGATLPVAVALAVPPGQALARAAGRLYALNSLGGAVGTALAGWVLLGRLGAWRTTLVAAGLNLLAAALALAAPPDPAASEPRSAESPPASWPAPSPRALLLTYALAGLSALALQVGWSRLVTLAVGSSVHGYTLTVASFILGLSLGSLLFPRWGALGREPARALFLLHGVVALWPVYSLGWVGGLPDRVLTLMEGDAGFEALALLQLGLVFATIAAPTLAMGAAFPLVAELARQGGRSSGRAVGSVYAANTLGTIAGAAVAGYLLVPWIGMRGTVLAAAGLSGLVALIYLSPRARRSPRAALLGLGLLLALAVGARGAPRWSQEVLTRAPFLYGHQGDDRRFGEVIEVVEGPTTAAAVRRLASGQKLLYVGGVLEATSSAPFHEYLAHLALLTHPDPRRVLVVGLGAGNTLSAALAYPLVELRCVELSPEVVALARRHFQAAALDDPRVELITGDGRTYLRHTAQTFEVIISQPSYPWMSGAASLFTREYFQEMREHLAPGGVAAIWFAAQSEQSSASLLATWAEVFPVSFTYSPGRAWEMVFVLGLASAGAPELERARTALADPRVTAAAARAGIRSAEGFVQGLQRLTADPAARLNTDDDSWVELEAFRALTERRGRSEERRFRPGSP